MFVFAARALVFAVCVVCGDVVTSGPSALSSIWLAVIANALAGALHSHWSDIISSKPNYDRRMIDIRDLI